MFNRLIKDDGWRDRCNDWQAISYGCDNGADFACKELTEPITHSLTIGTVDRNLPILIVVQQLVHNMPMFTGITSRFIEFLADVLASWFIDDLVCWSAGTAVCNPVSICLCMASNMPWFDCFSEELARCWFATTFCVFFNGVMSCSIVLMQSWSCIAYAFVKVAGLILTTVVGTRRDQWHGSFGNHTWHEVAVSSSHRFWCRRHNGQICQDHLHSHCESLMMQMIWWPKSSRALPLVEALTSCWRL